MDIKSLHHVAYRCKDAKQTAESNTPWRWPRTPQWVQHLALRVPEEKTLMRYKTICKSIYFFDPNGHRLELTVDTTTPEMKRRLSSVSEEMLQEWSRTKKAPHRADWVHKK